MFQKLYFFEEYHKLPYPHISSSSCMKFQKLFKKLARHNRNMLTKFSARSNRSLRNVATAKSPKCNNSINRKYSASYSINLSSPLSMPPETIQAPVFLAVLISPLENSRFSSLLREKLEYPPMTLMIIFGSDTCQQSVNNSYSFSQSV